MHVMIDIDTFAKTQRISRPSDANGQIANSLKIVLII
jgi:hypothetical protein